MLRGGHTCAGERKSVTAPSPQPPSSTAQRSPPGQYFCSSTAPMAALRSRSAGTYK